MIIVRTAIELDLLDELGEDRISEWIRSAGAQPHSSPPSNDYTSWPLPPPNGTIYLQVQRVTAGLAGGGATLIATAWDWAENAYTATAGGPDIGPKVVRVIGNWVNNRLPAAQAALQQLEIFVSRATAALEAENSVLRQQLAETRLRVAFLEGQLHSLNEARATGRPKIILAALGFVAAILTSAAGGAAEGIASATADAAQEPAAITAEQLVQECASVQVSIQLIGDEPELPRALPPTP